MLSRLCQVASVAAAVLMTATAARAITFTETGDAGNVPGAAQALGPVSSGDNILGSIGLAGDSDLYSIVIGAGILTFNTFAGPNLDDPQLFLFDGAGNGIAENDDAAGGTFGLQSEISLNLAAGTYFIGISRFNNDPVNGSGNEIFNTFNGNDLNGNLLQVPDSPVGGTVLAGFQSGGGGTGSYNITFASANAIPEPAALAAFGLGLAALGFTRRRRSA